LEHFPSSKILVSARAYGFLNIPLSQHAEHVERLLADHPSLAGRLESPSGRIDINCRLFYCVFLNNLLENLDGLEANGIPFAFQLYTGGGFSSGSEATEGALRRIFGSPNFRKVVVTQKRTLNYLVENGFCGEEAIVFVFGVVVPQLSLGEMISGKTF